jgi:hypothetical protein
MAARRGGRSRRRGGSKEEKERLAAELELIFDGIEEGFNGKYAEELRELSGLSQEDLRAVTPGGTDAATYQKLIAVVREASRVNLAQASLKKHIVELGETAVAIARKVPSLGALLG